MADQDDPRGSAAQTGDRTVIGGAPVAGGPTMASSGAFDTPGGGDLGGPGSRDQGDTTSDLRDPVGDEVSGGAAGGSLTGVRGDSHGGGLASAGGLSPDNRGGEERGAGLDAHDRGGGGAGFGQTAGTTQQDQAFGQGGGRSIGRAPEAGAGGGLNEQQDELRAQAEAQSRPDAGDAQDLQDKSRASAELGSFNDNGNL